MRTPIDEKTKTFPREYNGKFAENDIYIDCQHKIQIHYYGKGILEVYVPSLIRGNNIIKAIQSELGNDVIWHVEKTDSEVMFRFNSKYMKQLEKYLKPKTSGADRSPFSTKNLPKSKYIIPDEESLVYKEIIQKIGQNRIIELTHTTNNFLKSLATKKNTYEDIKANMALKCLKGKEYIHSIGKWDEYIDYLRKELNL